MTPNARIGMTPEDALAALDDKIAWVVAKIEQGRGGFAYVCFELPEARAISRGLHQAIDERPTHTPNEEVPI